MSELDGYRVGGTVHVVVNNQIGFTTSPRNGYSTTYCTDVARMLQIPIFHVNGEDPEAVAQVVDLAVDFRQRFHRDALIELWCYRKHGHNEADEPSYTQPQMYRAIAAKPSIRASYVEAFAALPGSDAQPAITDDRRRGVRRREARGARGRARDRGQAGEGAAAEHVRGRVGARARRRRDQGAAGADGGHAGDPQDGRARAQRRAVRASTCTRASRS